MENHIIDQIRTTGYPLEIEVSNLMDRDWIVYNNQPYLDEDENKTREIDIFARHEFTDAQFLDREKPPFYIGIYAAVECKKSLTHAWVFFTREKLVAINFGNDQITDFLETRSQGKRRLLDVIDLPVLRHGEIYRVARTYSQVRLQAEQFEEQRSGKNEIFEASNQLMKYTAYQVKEWRERMVRNLSGRDFVIMYLAIIFDGKLYEAITERGEIRIVEKSHVLLESARYSKLKTGMSNYVIDVIAKDYFPNYLGLINKDIRTLEAFLLLERDQLMRKTKAEIKALGHRQTIVSLADQERHRKGRCS